MTTIDRALIDFKEKYKSDFDYFFSKLAELDRLVEKRNDDDLDEVETAELEDWIHQVARLFSATGHYIDKCVQRELRKREDLRLPIFPPGSVHEINKEVAILFDIDISGTIGYEISFAKYIYYLTDEDRQCHLHRNTSYVCWGNGSDPTVFAEQVEPSFVGGTPYLLEGSARKSVYLVNEENPFLAMLSLREGPLVSNLSKATGLHKFLARNVLDYCLEPRPSNKKTYQFLWEVQVLRARESNTSATWKQKQLKKIRALCDNPGIKGSNKRPVKQGDEVVAMTPEEDLQRNPNPWYSGIYKGDGEIDFEGEDETEVCKTPFVVALDFFSERREVNLSDYYI